MRTTTKLVLVTATVPVLGGWLAALAAGAVFTSCYDTKPPTKPVSCSANPYQPGCLPPIHDERPL